MIIEIPHKYLGGNVTTSVNDLIEKSVYVCICHVAESVGSPDGSIEDYNRFRYGDSTDGSSSHSRSSSVADASVANKYRRTSSTTAPPSNPLQFVKVCLSITFLIHLNCDLKYVRVSGLDMSVLL